MNIDEKIEAKKKALLVAEEKRAKEKESIEELKRQSSVVFRKALAHAKYELGGEWFKSYANAEIALDSDFEKIIEDEKERMQRIFNSVPRCPKCGGLLLKAKSKNKDKFFWYCADKCGAKSVWDRNGLPHFKED